MVGQYEDRHVVDRVLTPPASPTLVWPGATDWPEHVASQYPGAHIVKAALGEVVVDTNVAALAAEELGLKCASWERPRMEGAATYSKRVLEALVWTCTEAFDGEGEALNAQSCHMVLRGLA
jgi:hypothetical protein